MTRPGSGEKGLQAIEWS